MSKASVDSKMRKFTQSNMHSKFFLVSLFMGLNSTEKTLIEKSRVLSLTVLPLMFVNQEYRTIVENKLVSLSQSGQLKTKLINHESKEFYRFIKQ